MIKTTSPWLVLTTVMIGTFMGALDSSIVNVSLPAMMRAFDVGLTQIEWVITSYMIAFAVSMPVTNWLKNQWSGRILYLASLALFTVGSGLCGLADSLDMLVVARVLQALGGGAMTPTAMAIIAETFREEERGQALGYWGLGVVLGPALGPTLGGLLTEYWSWRWIFWINLPVGLIGMYMCLKYLPDDRREGGPKTAFDAGGFISLTVFLVSLLYGLTRLEKGTFDLEIFTLLLISLGSFIVFLRCEHRTAAPLIDLKIFRNPVLRSCLLVTMARSTALIGGVFLLPFLLQGELGFSETQSGLLMLPGSLLLAFMMPPVGRLSDQRGARGLSLLGLGILVVSMLMLAGVGVGTGGAAILAILVIRGIGLGFLVTPVSAATVSSVPIAQVPMASSLSSLGQQIAGSFGVAGLGLLHLALQRGAEAAGHPRAALFALKGCFLVAAVLVLLAMWPARRLPQRIRRSEPVTEI